MMAATTKAAAATAAIARFGHGLITTRIIGLERLDSIWQANPPTSRQPERPDATAGVGPGAVT
jgi:hypothetical protein